MKHCPAGWFPTIKLRVFFDEKKAAKHMMKKHGNVQELEKDADTTFDGCGNVVIRFKDFEKNDESQAMALIAHESVHAAQEWCRVIGETNPAEEELAYMVQCVFLCVMEELEKHRKKLNK